MRLAKLAQIVLINPNFLYLTTVVLEFSGRPPRAVKKKIDKLGK